VTVRPDLAIEDLDGFLDLPLVAVLATHRKDGSILLSPVWHEWRDGGFNVWVGRDDVKARHLRNDPRATIVVAESAPPLRAVEVRTTVEFVEDAALEIETRIASRYIGHEKGDAYVRTSTGSELILRFVPGELRAWDFADAYRDGRF